MEPSPRMGRRLLLWIVGATFLMMAAIACWRMVTLRDLAIERERARLEEYIQDQVAAWEETVLKTLQDRLEAASADPSRAVAFQQNWRRHRWFDSLFLWVPPTDRADARMTFPVMSAPNTPARLRFSPCLQFADRLTMQGATNDQLVEAWILGCRDENDNVRLVASVTAATVLMGDGRYDEALLALDAVNLPDSLSLRNGAAQGIDPFRLASLRSQRVRLLLLTNRTDEALDLAVKLGEQMADLEAPDLGALANHMHEIASDLERNGRRADAARLAERFGRADRRKHAYDEVTRRLLHEQVSLDAPPPPRLVSDMYSDQPFLLYYGWANGLGVGLALEQDPLIDDFLRNRMKKLSSAITLDEVRTGRWVAGAKGGGKCAIEVQFNRTLTHLRVCVRETLVDATIAQMSEQWYFPLGIISICAVIGFAGLIAVDRATRHESELLVRQRAFSTRVTHELKTPLAGIRVMAENLEYGAFRDDDHRREMAHRIVAEADQLTKRVDEVLAVARQRTIPSPAPFDPEEALLLAIDEWGPRLRDAGVELHAELAPTDPIKGDGNALKDAVSCLLDNALKYRRESAADSQVWLDLAQVGRHVVISVTDNGIGVPKPMRRKIFDRFVRVEGPNRGKAGGHGLGLHQVKEIVVAHRGTVTCAEGVGGGARFVIRLPASR
ncbi:MAG: HAMP domain-containing sensor histidine kinase [Myxococcota bacterium]